MTNYLDIYELAELLEKRPETIRKNLKSRPWTVPPRMHIPGTRILRWRKHEVEAWLEEGIELRAVRCKRHLQND